ncbi:MAG: GTP pyrophosphokinase family protein [Acetatifactor sp.]|nr:GTP pyrophosphokinase family protein [Acetatifactor sp.]
MEEEKFLELVGSVDFRDEYGEVCRQLERQIREIGRQMSLLLRRDFIIAVDWRVKGPKSCAEKLKRKGRELTPENAAERLNDIAGVRVICSFLDDIYLLCERLANDFGYQVIKKKDYVKKPKRSGYQSLHLVLGIPRPDGRQIRAEIQLRTQAMDFWAGVEHHFVYKNDELPRDVVRKEFRECAKAIYNLDQKMMSLRDYLS